MNIVKISINYAKIEYILPIFQFMRLETIGIKTYQWSKFLDFSYRVQCPDFFTRVVWDPVYKKLLLLDGVKLKNTKRLLLNLYYTRLNTKY